MHSSRRRTVRCSSRLLGVFAQVEECLPRGVSAWGSVRLGVSAGGEGVYPSMHWGRHPSGQNSWHTLLKILPCRNFVADGKNRVVWYLELVRSKWFLESHICVILFSLFFKLCMLTLMRYTLDRNGKILEQESIPVGRVPPTCWPCTVVIRVSRWGWGGGLPNPPVRMHAGACWEANHPVGVVADACENITLPWTSSAGGKKSTTPHGKNMNISANNGKGCWIWMKCPILQTMDHVYTVLFIFSERRMCL